MKNLDSFNSEQKLNINKSIYNYFDLNVVADKFKINLSKVPITIKIILENLLRNEDGETVTEHMIAKIFHSLAQENKTDNLEIVFSPTRVLMQDFTGVPAVADLAAMRNALKKRGLEPKIINPLSRVDLIIDHSVMVDSYKNNDSLDINVKNEDKVLSDDEELALRKYFKKRRFRPSFSEGKTRSMKIVLPYYLPKIEA